MLELLGGIAQRSRESDDEYFGRQQLATLRGALDAAGSHAADGRRLQLTFDLAWHHLRLGEVDAAIERYRDVRRQIAALGDRVRPADAVRAAFDLGVAYLRLGEVQNCALMHNPDRCLLPIRGGGVHQLREGSRNASRYLLEVLESPAADRWLKLRARWLLNITYMTLGEYPAGVPAPHLIEPSAFESDEPFPRFTDVAHPLGLDAMTLAGGVVVDDLDGDGFLDILVSTWNPSGPLRYYRNAGDGTFSDRSVEAGLVGLVGGLNLRHADYDGDGDIDVLVLRGAWLGARGRHPNSLLRNDGEGHFVDVTFAAGLGDEHYPTQTAEWADYDNDGDLDLYVGNETSAELDAPCQLFQNDGSGSFQDVARAAGVENGRFTKGVAWGDYDGDRLPDLYVSNLGAANRLYRNNGDGSFTDVAESLGVGGPIHSFSVWFWDFDNDGALDLFVSAYGGGSDRVDVADVAASYLDVRPRAERARLYRGDGRGGFRDVAASQNLTRVTLPMGSNFGDLDNDGFPEFYLGTGYPLYDGLMPNVMYRNRRGTGFADVTTSGGFGHLQKGHAIAFADLDNDGDQDVFAEMGGAFPGDTFANALFENPGSSNHWLKVRLVGVESNRSAIGTRIRLEIREEGRSRSIFAHTNAGSSFGSNPLRREIGVGAAAMIDVLEVFWPTTGETQRFRDVDVDQWIEIEEGGDRYRRLPRRPARFHQGAPRAAP